MQNITPFSLVYDNFLSRITEDLYLELSELDTYAMLEELLMAAIHKFEFPRKDLNDFTLLNVTDERFYDGIESHYCVTKLILYNEGYFNSLLTMEEINILGTYMIVEWLGQQLASIELTRMKYSGSDFKFTSQANQMTKLLALKKDYEREGFHLQRLYCRRIVNEHNIQESTMHTIMEPIRRPYYNVHHRRWR